MGNVFKKNQGTVQAAPQQGGVYAPNQQQPMVQQQPQYAQQPMGQQPMMQQPMGQQPMMQQPMGQQPMMQQPRPQYAPQQPPQYRPSAFSPQQQSYRPAFPSGPSMPHYSGPSSLSLPNGPNRGSYYENDAFLSNLTGWPVQDIERLRHEFLSYTNSYGVIDRGGFHKLYVASLLNMSWEAVESEAEAAFRSFDINQTGVLDFNEYITACSRMARESMSGPPPSNQPYNY